MEMASVTIINRKLFNLKIITKTVSIINFKCNKCKDEFDCEIGKVTFPDNVDEKLNFEKEIICPNCGVIKVGDAELQRIWLIELPFFQILCLENSNEL